MIQNYWRKSLTYLHDWSADIPMRAREKNQDWPRSWRCGTPHIKIVAWTRWDVIWRLFVNGRWRHHWNWLLHVKVGWHGLETKNKATWFLTHIPWIHHRQNQYNVSLSYLKHILDKVRVQYTYLHTTCIYFLTLMHYNAS